MSALRCTLCGTDFTRADAAVSGRRAVLRHLAYASICGIFLAGLAYSASDALVGRVGLAAMVIGPLAILCLGRALVLHVRAGAYERLESHEIEQLERWLCPGMIRSDVFEVLSRHGWRAAKIRTVLAALQPIA